MFLNLFSMNLLRILVSSWSVFILVQETVSLEEVLLLKVAYDTPLAVIKNRDSTLKLAIPHYKNKYDDYAAYNYDDTGGEKLLIACPASGDKQLKVEKNRKLNGVTLSESKLLFLSEYTEPKVQCSTEVAPTVLKVTEGKHVEHCSRLQAEMYEVGYPVSNDDEGKVIQFLSIYKICYSHADGKAATLYSIHRIESPSLLFMDSIWELPSNDKPLSSFSLYKSELDINQSTKKSFEGMVYYKHQFVGKHDMSSIRRWELTTYFLFNYTPITLNVDLYKGIIRAEWYIRLLSKKENKPLTLYSGTHQRIGENRLLYWIKKRIHLAKLVDLFWRVILDDKGYAIILVIQHNLKKCGRSAYLCKEPIHVKKYKKGGCIYTCSMKENENLFELLGLPPLRIAGDLDFRIQSENGVDGRRGPTYDIVDFLSNKSFLEALTNVDPNILRKGGLVQA